MGLLKLLCFVFGGDATSHHDWRIDRGIIEVALTGFVRVRNESFRTHVHDVELVKSVVFVELYFDRLGHHSLFVGDDAV